jgi:hypothetical protein
LPRPAAKALAACLFAILLAALVPALASARRPGGVDAAQVSCPGAPTDAEFAANVRAAGLIVIGSVSDAGSDGTVTDRGWIEIRPEAFLKGNPSAAHIRFATSLPGPCSEPTISTARGARVLVLAAPVDGQLAWPEPQFIYVLADGQARNKSKGDTTTVAEAELVERIRAVTGQVSFAAESSGEGAGIDWRSTVLPIGGACIVLMVVGLLLMRVWHRIDPS